MREQDNQIKKQVVFTEENRNRFGEVVQPLLNWFDSHARVLPWREEPTPYRVWISEIMLQQTRVEAVKPYYDRFLKRLPNVEMLAEVPDEELLKLWEGLGYYNRARNLKKAAGQIVEKYSGQLPKNKKELMELPGIGSYTAGAISSIAYGQPNPAVDGNVLRVVARLLACREDVLDAKIKQQFEELVGSVIPVDRSGSFNQALMELGAMVCVPNGEPKCEECPWKQNCEARKNDLIGCIPHKSSKKPRKVEEMTVFIIRNDRAFAIRKRPATGLLAGMYEFPWSKGHLSTKEVIGEVQRLGFSPIRVTRISDSTHIFTHKEWHMRGYEIKVDELAPNLHDKKILFVETAEAKEKYPIPSAFAKYKKEYLS